MSLAKPQFNARLLSRGIRLMELKDVLQSVTFGARVAEDETDELANYFVETEQWNRIYRGDVDIIYGVKGSGKSAIYSLLLNKRIELTRHGVYIVEGENLRGETVFRDLVTDPPISELEFMQLWKLFILSLIGKTLAARKSTSDEFRKMYAYLQDAQLVEPQWSLPRIFKAVRDFIKQFRPAAIEASQTVDGTTGFPVVTGRVVLGSPDGGQHGGLITLDELIDLADEALASLGNIWIALDRLDVAFADNRELEENALRALFKVYLDIRRTKRIKLKVFLRSDIWSRITTSGFREASHITRTTIIDWKQGSLLHLIIRRALVNKTIVKFYKADPVAVLSTTEEQRTFFYKMLPEQVERGERRPNTLDWILTRVSDGSQKPAPREVIHILNCAVERQMAEFDRGGYEPDGGCLLSGNAFKDALPEVSETRLNQTLYAEYPSLRPYIEKLEGEKTSQRYQTLSDLWKIGRPKTIDICNDLISVGFFEPRGAKADPELWVPFLYRSALNMVQGAAD